MAEETTSPKTAEQKIEAMKSHIEFLIKMKGNGVMTSEAEIHISEKIKSSITKLTELVFLENTGAKY